MEINLGFTDRISRMVLGTALAYWALAASNVWAVVLVAVAGIAIVSGATGRCMIYRLLGLSTASRHTAAPPAGAAAPRPRPALSTTLEQAQRSPDSLAEAIRHLLREGNATRLTIRDGDWTVIDLPLTVLPSGVLEAPLLEFIRARAEESGYYKLTVRH